MNLLDQCRVVAPAAAVQQRDDLALGQGVSQGGGGRGTQDRKGGLVPQVRERDQRLRMELQKH